MDSCFLRFRGMPEGVDPPDRFTNPFNYSPHPLAESAAQEIQELLGPTEHWKGAGRMFGVLVVRNAQNEIGYLVAYSGRERTSHLEFPFVPLIYDAYAQMPNFASGVREVENMSETLVAERTQTDLEKRKSQLLTIKANAEKAIEHLKERNSASKKERDRLRASDKDVNAALLRAQSRQQKAELVRLRKEWSLKREEAEAAVAGEEDRLRTLKQARAKRSAQLQEELFAHFEVVNARGERENLFAIFQKYSVLSLPPSGSGECAAPKLLHYAFERGYQPLCMAEFWWGSSPPGQIREAGQYYPACKGRCEPILSFMLQGLSVDPDPLQAPAEAKAEIQWIYEDKHIVVLVKPEGLLSVPGKREKDSVQERLKKRFPNAPNPKVTHRLDMGTSGLMIAALDNEALGKMQKQFVQKRVEKRYIALLERDLSEVGGSVNLPLTLDYIDRPRQMVCFEAGKPSFTIWERVEVINGHTRVRFYPKTGRTHQLRVHAAHKDGLHAPIVGDRLYGNPAERMYLHAEYIAFRHPIYKHSMEFNCPPAF